MNPDTETASADLVHDALKGLRIGCVAYLNARPLIEAYHGPVVLGHPAALATALVRGDLDVALVPVYEALRQPAFRRVDGVSISARGPVWSVFVAYRGALDDVRTVYLDPASLTSAHLCKAIFAEWGASVPDYLPLARGGGSDSAAQLLIGNQAIEFRERYGSEFQYLDLGEEWTRRTGLPFVFAVWLMRPEIPRSEQVARAFRTIARQGERAIPHIVARHSEFSAEFATRYLTRHIRFGLGDAEKQAMTRFRELLWTHRLLPAGESPLHFV